MSLSRLQLVPQLGEVCCIVCRDRSPDYRYTVDRWVCERCGASFHVDCYLRMIPRAEWKRYDTATVEDLEREPYLILCGACRN